MHALGGLRSLLTSAPTGSAASRARAHDQHKGTRLSAAAVARAGGGEGERESAKRAMHKATLTRVALRAPATEAALPVLRANAILCLVFCFVERSGDLECMARCGARAER